MAYLTFYPKFAASDDNGDPLASGKLYTYESGASTTPLATYTDAAAGTENANPTILNSRGEANVWPGGGKLYRYVLKTSADVTIWTVDAIGGGATVVGTRDGTYTKLSSVSGTDTITATGPADIAAYAEGQTFSFIVANTNTGAATINISSLGAKSITKTGTTALAAGDLPQNAVVMIRYDGTRFQLIAVPASASTSLSLAGGTMTGAITFAAGTPAKNLLDGICEGRLTLTTGTPVPTADQLSKTTVYFAPFKGNRVAVYDGTNWQLRTFTELSVVVPSTTATPFDVWIYDNSGTLTLETTNWSSASARATALTTQDGVYVKTGALTRRYLGTVCTTGVSGQTEDSYANRLVWNYYNRVRRPQKVVDATNTWNYTTATWRQANSSSANQFANVTGVAEDAQTVEVWADSSNASAVYVAVGVGIDSTSANSAQIYGGYNGGSGVHSALYANYTDIPAAGLHTFAWLEISQASGTTAWYGDAGISYLQSGMVGSVMA